MTYTTKTEAELIAAVAKLNDAAACLRFADRNPDKPALVAACRPRAEALKPRKTPTARRLSPGKSAPLKTLLLAEQALALLAEDYNAGRPPTNYDALAKRCGVVPGRGFGQVTDLIDAACALAGVPSFAIVRVLDASGKINSKAYSQGPYVHLRELIIERALAATWTDDDFTKIKEALAFLVSVGFGNDKSWDLVRGKIDMDAWARGGSFEAARVD